MRRTEDGRQETGGRRRKTEDRRQEIDQFADIGAGRCAAGGATVGGVIIDSR
jgi:hypothetical protein